jgi:hypothetical protein
MGTVIALRRRLAVWLPAGLALALTLVASVVGHGGSDRVEALEKTLKRRRLGYRAPRWGGDGDAKVLCKRSRSRVLGGTYIWQQRVLATNTGVLDRSAINTVLVMWKLATSSLRSSDVDSKTTS